MTATLRAAAWAGEQGLVLVGDLPGLEPGGVDGIAGSGTRPVELAGHCLAPMGNGRVVILNLPEGEVPSLELRSNGGAISLHADELERALVSRTELQRLVLSSALPHLDGPGGFSLGKDLHEIRDALRRPLPQPAIENDEPQSVFVDRLLGLDDRAFLIEGWTRDEDGTFTRLTVISPDGQEVALEKAFRFRRPDVEEQLTEAGPRYRHGFLALFELPAPSRLENGWIVQWTDPEGRGIETAVPAADHSAQRAQELLLERFAQDQPNREELRRNHLRPALARLQDRHRDSIEVDSIVDYGVPNASPTVSIVVTLYGRIDLLHHQVLHFAQDPGMREAEVIYVLDSPELGEPLNHLASQIHALHGFPFRVAKLSRNAGFPVANILGTALARGRLLLLLNSDVLPDRPGWLEQMVNFYDSQPDIGALGPKLLFEDDSIQHAGVYFERELASGLWGNLHYFKGLHRYFPAATVKRPVPAVTGACLMVDRALYEDVGGLRHEYILQGGYEDSDLCLRLIDRGRRNWYLADAELYHLEGQAHAPASRQTTVTHNTWLQTELWGPLIEQVMSDETAPAPERREGGEGAGNV
jgi:GT2 family glycosyltransferase